MDMIEISNPNIMISVLYEKLESVTNENEDLKKRISTLQEINDTIMRLNIDLTEKLDDAHEMIHNLIEK